MTRSSRGFLSGMMGLAGLGILALLAACSGDSSRSATNPGPTPTLGNATIVGEVSTGGRPAGGVEVTVDGNLVKVASRSGSNFSNAMAGTTRAHLANMVTGVTKGFEKKLELVGVGYRAAVQGLEHAEQRTAKGKPSVR